MTTAIIIAFACVIGIVLLLEVRRLSTPVNLKLVPIDILAIRSLVAPSETVFMRENLSPADFLWYRRERNRVVLGYVEDVSRNCAVVLSWARSLSTTEAAAPATVELVQATLRTRLLSLAFAVVLRLLIFMPAIPAGLETIIDRYEWVSARISRLPLAAKA